MAINFWDEEFQVNRSIEGGQRSFSDQAVAAMSDGRLIVVWQGALDEGDGNGSGFGNCVRARIMNPDGSPAGPDFVVNTTTQNEQGDAAVAVLSDGRFVVTWGSNETGDGAGTCVRARVFNADGTPDSYNGSSNDFIVNNIAGENQFSPTVTALDDGAFVIGFTSPPAAFSFHDIKLRMFTATGPVSGEFAVNSGSHNGSADITRLKDGGFVVSYTDGFVGNTFPGNDGNNIVARVYNENGTARTGLFLAGTTPTSSPSSSGLGESTVGALKDGGFVVVWTFPVANPPLDTNSTSIRARVFNADGSVRAIGGSTADFQVNTTTNSEQRVPHVVGLDDGGFFITYSSKSNVAGDFVNTIIGRMFKPDGTPVGGDFNIKTGIGAGGGAYSLNNDVIMMPDGRPLVLYINDPANRSDVQGRFFDFSDFGVNQSGDGAANEMLGTAAADTLKGEGGNDFLMGGGGADFLEGGAGGDRLHGGGFNDNLKGGGGLDLLNGGPGVDTADYSDQTVAVQVFLNDAADGFAAVNNIFEDVLRAIEYVVGGSGNDTLVGDSGINALYGGGGRDFLFANGFAPDGTMKPNANTDSLFGEAGDDGLFGGDGNDTLWGADGSDGLVGGGGDDYMNGGAGPDFLFGGDFNPDGSPKGNSGKDQMNGDGGNDAIYGFDGNDVITGGADNDYLDGGGGDDTVEGGLGNDFVLGDNGTDTVTGGAGFDYLYGGPGNDIFVYRKGDSADWILDWSADILRLEGFGFANFAAIPLVDVSTAEAGPAVQLTVFNAANSTYDQLTIFGAKLADLNAGNVLIV